MGARSFQLPPEALANPGQVRTTPPSLSLRLAVSACGGCDVFDDTTTPKGVQVEGVITMAVNQLVSRVDVPIKTEQVGQGRWLATLYASAMTALVFVPEQNAESPVYTGLMTEYGAQINEWVRANRFPLVPYIG
jgi:hypothetical protein